MLGKASWYSIDVSGNDRHILLFYKKCHFCHLLPFAKVGQYSMNWLYDVRSGDVERVQCKGWDDFPKFSHPNFYAFVRPLMIKYFWKPRRRMDISLTIGQKSAATAALSLLPASVWLRQRHPNLWDDAKYTLTILGWLKAVERAKLSGKTIVDHFEQHAQESPLHPCVLYRDELYSYAEVAANTNRTARWISRQDPSLKKGDVVCILLHNGPTFVWTFFGLLKMGVIASCINYNLKRAALLHNIRTSEAKKLIFGSGKFRNFLPLSLKSVLNDSLAYRGVGGGGWGQGGNSLAYRGAQGAMPPFNRKVKSRG